MGGYPAPPRPALRSAAVFRGGQLAAALGANKRADIAARPGDPLRRAARWPSRGVRPQTT